jgi:hypothetical protein
MFGTRRTSSRPGILLMLNDPVWSVLSRQFSENVKRAIQKYLVEVLVL